MPLNTKDIRRRIKSVESTKKITKAMEMVAAAKVRRAQLRVMSNRPYAHKLAEVFAHVTANLPPGEVRHPLLDRREIKKALLVVVTSDKGLCGGYNSNIIRFAVERMRTLKSQGIQVAIVVVGTKGVNFFRHANFEVVARIQGLSAIPTFVEAEALVNESIGHYEKAAVDKVELIYTRFGGMTRFIPTRVDVLPASLAEMQGEGIADPTALAEAGGFTNAAHPEAVAHTGAPYLYEPDAEAMVSKLIPAYLSNEVYQAMGAASKSAGEMISHLTLVYNKARQAGITQELLEVVGGAEALKG